VPLAQLDDDSGVADGLPGVARRVHRIGRRAAFLVAILPSRSEGEAGVPAGREVTRSSSDITRAIR